MKKLLLILLCVPLLFSCGENNEEKKDNTENTEKNEYNRYDVNDTYIRNVLDFDDEEEMRWIFPNTILYHKNDEGYEKRISEGIVYERDNNNLYEKFISDNITYKIVFTENNQITSVMELVSDNKWIQREYYKDGQLEEEEEYLFKNNEFIKCGVERLYYENGQLKSDGYNYNDNCGEPPISIVTTSYHENGQKKQEDKFDFVSKSYEYLKCWDENGKVRDCPWEINGSSLDRSEVDYSSYGDSLSLSDLKINNQLSNIKWIGSKVTESHYGTINIDRGVLEIDEGGELVGGEFVIDMNSLLCTDIENEIYKKKLEDHLKDEDFFDVSNFPNSGIKITDVDKVEAESYRITADLTIKDITHSINFDAYVKKQELNYEVISNIKIDRTKWDVQYNSGNFFENLGDKLILDEIEFDVYLISEE